MLKLGFAQVISPRIGTNLTSHYDVNIEYFYVKIRDCMVIVLIYMNTKFGVYIQTIKFPTCCGKSG